MVIAELAYQKKGSNQVRYKTIKRYAYFNDEVKEDMRRWFKHPVAFWCKETTNLLAASHYWFKQHDGLI